MGRKSLKKPAIAIVGSETEVHSLRLKELLEARGAEVLLIDTVKYPAEVSLSLLDDEVLYNRRSLDLVQVYFVKALFYSLPPYDLEKRRREIEVDLDNWYVEYIAERERQSHLSSFLWMEAGKGKHVVNPVDSFDVHYLKPYQVQLLKRNGIPVPRTLVTNDAEELMRFAAAVKDVVYKPVAGGAACERLNPRDLTKERLELLKTSPVLFQELIEGENIRVYAIEDEIVSSNIIQSDSLDYRGAEKGFVHLDLSEDIRALCVKAMKVCHMKYSGIDLIRRPNGEFVFLECNPSPMFLSIVRQAGDPVDEKLADYLMRLAGGPK
jgi:glutathione synthase/RimK-type ligase-like ATP-grasp enzyme